MTTNITTLSIKLWERRQHSTVEVTLTMDAVSREYELFLEETVTVKGDSFTLNNASYNKGDSKSIHKHIGDLWNEHRISSKTAKLLIRYLRVTIEMKTLEVKKNNG